MSPVVIDPRQVRDLSSDLLDANGDLRVVPASFYAGTTVAERGLFGHRHALYGFITEELVAFLRLAIGSSRAIEIGAGTGDLGRVLGIPATDSWLQARPDIAALYSQTGQPAVRYGAHVHQLDAAAAVRQFQPELVLASWVTHKYDPARHQAGGNMYGVDEEDILAHCRTYLFLGNEEVHKAKSLWRRPHKILFPDWLYSRATNGSRNFIALWGEVPVNLAEYF